MPASNATDSNFEQEVLQSPQPVVVDVWAPWCGPCKMVGPALERITESDPNRFKLVMANMEEFADKAKELDIRATPTLLVFKDGKEIGRKSGAMNQSMLQQWLDLHI